MKLFGQYSEAIRGKALRVLSEDLGIHCWSHDFDVNSQRVLIVCEGIERGETDFSISSKSLYTWTEPMRTAYHNSINGTPGKRTSSLPDYSVPFGWSHA